jgi:hypothetical protein
LARNGVATLSIEFAKNDIAGRWRIAVRDALTGLETRGIVELE